MSAVNQYMVAKKTITVSLDSFIGNDHERAMYCTYWLFFEKYCRALWMELWPVKVFSCIHNYISTLFIRPIYIVSFYHTLIDVITVSLSISLCQLNGYYNTCIGITQYWIALTICHLIASKFSDSTWRQLLEPPIINGWKQVSSCSNEIFRALVLMSFLAPNEWWRENNPKISVNFNELSSGIHPSPTRRYDAASYNIYKFRNSYFVLVAIDTYRLISRHKSLMCLK